MINKISEFYRKTRVAICLFDNPESLCYRDAVSDQAWGPGSWCYCITPVGIWRLIMVGQQIGLHMTLCTDHLFLTGELHQCFLWTQSLGGYFGKCT